MIVPGNGRESRIAADRQVERKGVEIQCEVILPMMESSILVSQGKNKMTIELNGNSLEKELALAMSKFGINLQNTPADTKNIICLSSKAEAEWYWTG